MSDSFRFDYQPATVRYGPGVVDALESELARHGYSLALVVCGTTVGQTASVVEPVTQGLGDRLVEVFDRTSADKYLATAVEGAERVQATDADVLVGLGAGSSLDTTKLVAVIAGHDRPPEAVAREMVADGAVHLPDGDLPPLVVVPTTLAGADLSVVAGTRLTLDPDRPDEEIAGVGVSDGQLMPVATVYDPTLFEQTPRSVLVESAMNGFDKGVEMIYGRDHTAVTDATAVRGLRLLCRGLPTLGSDAEAFDDIVRGMILVQYGLSTESTYRASLIHAFGHGFSRGYDVTQGIVHAILAPHVLSYLFEQVGGRRQLLARAFDVETTGRSREEVADAIVAEVTAVRDAMGLPSQLRSIDDLKRSDFPAVVDTILADSFMHNVPAGLDPTREEIADVLDRAW
jgi:alcohol dehydrogenase